MGIGSIMKAKKVLLVANGAGKAEILYPVPVWADYPGRCRRRFCRSIRMLPLWAMKNAMSVIREKCPEMI